MLTEYTALYSVAPPIVQCAMELAYLCCARQSDILALTKAQLINDGIFIRQGKTGKKQIKQWSSRLRNIVALAETLPIIDGMAAIYVINQPRGYRYTRDGFNSRWAKAKQEAKDKFPELDFTFHYLKAKGDFRFGGIVTG